MLTLRTSRLVGALLVAAQAARFSQEGRFVDDAWISFRVARTLLESGQLTYDGTQPPVEGATNLTWVLLSALGQLLLPWLEPGLFARGLGFFCLLGALWILTGLAARLARPGAEGAAALGVAILLGAAGNLAYHALGGLETGLYLLTFAAALSSLWPGDGAAPVARPALVGALLAGMGATRPEGVLLAGLLLAAAWPRQGLVVAAGVFAAGIAGLEGFRLAYYGALVPNTFHAKPPDAGAGWSYLLGFAAAIGGVGVLGLLALLRDAAWRRVALVVAIMTAGAVWSGGDWMPGYRRLVEPFAVLVLAAAVAAAREGVARAAGLVAALGLVGGAAAQAASGADAGRYGLRVYGMVGELLAATPGVDTVASADIGQLGWAFSGSVVDLVGLTDRVLARGFDATYVARRDPDVLLVVAEARVPFDLGEPAGMRPLEAPALAWARNTGRYHVHTGLPMPGGTTMTVIVRDDVELPAAQWGPRDAR